MTQRLFLSILGAALLSGCIGTGQVKVHEPTTIRPPERPASRDAGNGAIYQVASYQPLFEDRRARHLGDVLTVVIAEKINATQKNATSASRSGSVSVDVPTVNLPFLNAVPVLNQIADPTRGVAGTSLSASSANKTDGKGQSEASNVFTGTIAVTVIEVLPNGNLLVSGEKQIGTNREKETLRFSGIVDPKTILNGNQVSSIYVADARLDYVGEGQIDSAQVAGWLARFFLSFLPF